MLPGQYTLLSTGIILIGETKSLPFYEIYMDGGVATVKVYMETAKSITIIKLDKINDQWSTLAVVRGNWKSRGEAFVQQWASAG